MGRALRELGIQLIHAYSPLARDRSERGFGTWQGRLPQELRLRGLTTTLLPISFYASLTLGEFNQRFTVKRLNVAPLLFRLNARTWSWFSRYIMSAR